LILCNVHGLETPQGLHSILFYPLSGSHATDNSPPRRGALSKSVDAHRVRKYSTRFRGHWSGSVVGAADE
jgi:hypothetical protein